MSKRFLTILFSSLFLAGVLGADQGTTAAAFLKLATGPRAIAMGENFAGLADDVNALNYNPAGLAFVRDKELTVMHAVWFQDIYYDDLGMSWALGTGSNVGLSLLYLNGGNFDKYIESPVGSGNYVQAGQFTASDMALGFSYAMTVLPNLSLGVLGKYISEAIDSSSANSFAVDFSGFYRTPIPTLGVGFNVQNLGPGLGFSQTYNLPINFRIGVGYKPMKAATVAVDIVQPIETAMILGIGGEYSYRDFLTVRGGYKYQGAIDYNQFEAGYGPSVASGLSMGFGLKFLKHYYADYAYVPYGFLGSTHRLSFLVKF
jgi:long-subunit fatty acid transport protein